MCHSCLPLGFGSSRLDISLDLSGFLTKRLLDGSLSHFLGEDEAHDHVFLTRLQPTMVGVEETHISASCAHGVGMEVGAAVIVGGHASLLRGEVAARYDVLT